MFDTNAFEKHIPGYTGFVPIYLLVMFSNRYTQVEENLYEVP